jgi:YD repeat-containing protein
LQSLLQPLAVGGSAGYRAPRGLESVRARLGITKSGAAVGTARRTTTRVRYDQYGQRIASRSRSGQARVGSSSRQPAAFGIWSAVKSSIIIGSVVSAVTNGYALLKGQVTGAQAGTNFAGDVVSSAVGGTAAAVASWAGCGMLASFGMAGGLLTVAGIGLGIAGYFVADKLLRETTQFKSFQSGVYSMLGGK